MELSYFHKNVFGNAGWSSGRSVRKLKNHLCRSKFGQRKLLPYQGIKLMLAPRSAKAKQSTNSGKSHGMRNLPRNHGDPALLINFEEINMVNNNQNNHNQPPLEGGDVLAPDLRTMEELCQSTLNGRGGPIAPFAVQANDLGLKHHMIQQVENSCQFHGLPSDDANKHLDKFLHITQSMKQNRVTDDALCLYLFPYSLTHHAAAWFDRLLRNSILSFDQMETKFLSKYFPPSMVTKLRNKITNFR
nr:reverse transcriptase domain-containing protein [Tanacetum cinerariifolium]GFA45217.1 reverse transcriptase domain-containing protein [Tanacetum cinerariifolium]